MFQNSAQTAASGQTAGAAPHVPVAGAPVAGVVAIVNGKVTTTDATTTTVVTVALPANCSAVVFWQIAARRTDVAGTVQKMRQLGAKCTAGTAELVGAPATVGTDTTDGVITHATTQAASGTNVLLQVTGAAAQTIEHSVTAYIVCSS